MNDDEMIARLVAAADTNMKPRTYIDASFARLVVSLVRAAGFEVVERGTLDRLEHQLAGYERECYAVGQALGRALGYPHAPDEHGNPDPTAPICTGKHTPASLAAEAEMRIWLLEYGRAEPEGPPVEPEEPAAEPTASSMAKAIGDWLAREGQGK